jgi:hypothetical protein
MIVDRGDPADAAKANALLPLDCVEGVIPRSGLPVDDRCRGAVRRVRVGVISPVTLGR